MAIFMKKSHEKTVNKSVYQNVLDVVVDVIKNCLFGDLSLNWMRFFRRPHDLKTPRYIIPHGRQHCCHARHWFRARTVYLFSEHRSFNSEPAKLYKYLLPLAVATIIVCRSLIMDRILHAHDVLRTSVQKAVHMSLELLCTKSIT